MLSSPPSLSVPNRTRPNRSLRFRPPPRPLLRVKLIWNILKKSGAQQQENLTAQSENQQPLRSSKIGIILFAEVCCVKKKFYGMNHYMKRNECSYHLRDGEGRALKGGSQSYILQKGFGLSVLAVSNRRLILIIMGKKSKQNSPFPFDSSAATPYLP